MVKKVAQELSKVALRGIVVSIEKSFADALHSILQDDAPMALEGFSCLGDSW